MYSQIARTDAVPPGADIAEAREPCPLGAVSGLVRRQISRLVAGRLTPALHASRASYVVR